MGANMKKLYILLAFLLFCSGCAAQTEKMEEMEDTKIAEITDNVLPVETENEQEEIVKEELTMDKIKLLAEKEELCLQDLLVWEGLSESSLSSAESLYYYTILEGDKEYRLEFSTGQDGQLGFVRLADMQTMLSIDIRTGNIEHLLCNEVRMEDYLTFAFPEEIMVEDYDLYAGHFGGCGLTLVGKDGTVPCGGICILNGNRVSPSIVSGEMLAVANYDNNIYHSEKERLSIEQCPALLTFMSVEEENGESTQYYSVYFAQESDFYCYNLRLRADLFTKEEVIAIAGTVQFAVPTRETRTILSKDNVPRRSLHVFSDSAAQAASESVGSFFNSFSSLLRMRSSLKKVVSISLHTSSKTPFVTLT